MPLEIPDLQGKSLDEFTKKFNDQFNARESSPALSVSNQERGQRVLNDLDEGASEKFVRLSFFLLSSPTVH